MSGKKILVVEDSAALRTVLADRLRKAEFSVVEASGGKEGLEIAQSQKPDLIITDIIMYPMDGLEMAKRIREHAGWGEKVNIIALTNQNLNEEKGRVDPLRLSNYLVKADTPIEDVVKKVEEIFKEMDK